mmetsp:Transcript_39150/g.80193  ORF Transcript_39150/g.80193 Transcript_39150/m.80193 type:complete len:328 (-) Transcript_39150:956-1939(-)
MSPAPTSSKSGVLSPPAPGSPTPTVSLVVDELDRNCYIGGNSNEVRRTASSTPRVVGMDKIKAMKKSAVTLGPTDFSSLAPCPCCARYVVKDGAHQQQQRHHHQQQQQQQAGTDAAVASAPAALASSPSAEDDRNDTALAGSLDSTVDYTVTSILVQGWVHKKGTGRDIFGSRAWKSRWATLATASVPGYAVDVPVLLIHWFPTSETPSNVLVLDPARTVVMPIDRYPDEEKVVQWNTFTFEIVHSKQSDGGGGVGGDDGDVTRIFSVPEKERSEWVLAINQSLRDYEQRLKKSKKQEEIKKVRSDPSGLLLRPPLSPRSSKDALHF